MHKHTLGHELAISRLNMLISSQGGQHSDMFANLLDDESEVGLEDLWVVDLNCK